MKTLLASAVALGCALACLALAPFRPALMVPPAAYELVARP